MAVGTTHPEYEANRPLWQKIDDVLGGDEAVKARCIENAAQVSQLATANTGAQLALLTQSYLPMLDGQTPADYAGYLSRAEFFNATARTVAGLVGAVFASDPAIELTGPLVPIEDNADQKGTPLSVLAKGVLNQVVRHGRIGVLLERSANPQTPNEAPYLCCYAATDILNWRVSIRGGRPQLTQVVLRECLTEPDPDDEFSDVTIEQYRVLELVGGVYQVRILREEEDGTDQLYALDESGTYVPTDAPIIPLPQRGGPLDYIPFVFIGPQSLSPRVERSPILDLVDVNLHHFGLSAQLNNGLFITSLPQPVVIGDSTRDTTKPGDRRIGTTLAWELPLGADAKYLEFAGPGLQAIRDEMEADESRMVLLGARLLEPQKRAAEAAEALRLRQAGESATLATVADTTSWGLSTVLGWAADWVGVKPEDNYITLNQEFGDTSMTEQDANLVWARKLDGGATLEDVYWLYLRGGRINPEQTLAQWKLALANEAVAVPTQPLFGTPPLPDTPAKVAA
jgi:hypothetical protein